MPRGVRVRTASMRTRLIATAVKTCCKCVCPAHRSALVAAPSCERLVSASLRCLLVWHTAVETPVSAGLVVVREVLHEPLADADAGRDPSSGIAYTRCAPGQPAQTCEANTTSMRSPATRKLELVLALRAGSLLVLPIDLEMGQLEPLACFGLPTIVS